MSGISNNFLGELDNKEFRDEYTSSRVRTALAYQIRALRNQSDRNWSQSDLGKRLNKPQSVVSRLEDREYGKVTVQTLLEVAAAFDIQLLVQFVECEDFLGRMENLSPSVLEKRSYDSARVKQAVSSTNTTTIGPIVVLGYRSPRYAENENPSMAAIVRLASAATISPTYQGTYKGLI